MEKKNETNWKSFEIRCKPNKKYKKIIIKKWKSDIVSGSGWGVVILKLWIVWLKPNETKVISLKTYIVHQTTYLDCLNSFK